MGGLKEMFCKHKHYIVTDCQKKEKKYSCRCLSCGYQFTLMKAVGEMYEIGSEVKLR